MRQDLWHDLRRFILAGLLIALVLGPLFVYVYLKGCQAGIAQYKRSKSFMLTLQSIYVMGLSNGCDECRGGKI